MVRAVETLFRNILRSLRHNVRPLLAFHLYYSILATAVFTPLAGWGLAVLLEQIGHSMISNEDLVAFFFIPAGMLWLLVFGVTATVFVFFQHAGIMLVVVAKETGREERPAKIIWRILVDFPV